MADITNEGTRQGTEQGALARGLTRPSTDELRRDSLADAADLRRQYETMKQQTRGVAVVAAELEHAQEQAVRVKPLREELDKLLGRKVRTRKAGGK